MFSLGILASMRKVLFGIGVALLLWGNQALAQAIPTLDFFHGRECPHCHTQKKWFKDLQKAYPDIQINEYEVWHDKANQARMAQALENLGRKFELTVPTNIIEDDVIVGFNPEAILAALAKHYGPPTTNAPPSETKPDAEGWRRFLTISWPAMSLVLGLIDGFNPCAMWSLLILIGFLLTIDDKKKRWWIGGVFIGASAVLYFGALMAYLFGFSQISTFVASGAMTWVFRVVGLIAIWAGVQGLRASRKAEIECEVQDPGSKKRFADKMRDILAREKLPLVLVGMVGLAFSINAIELLCSFAIPTAFTATLVSGGVAFWEQLTAILIYTAAYIFDDTLVFVLAMWTLSVKVLSPKLVQISHLIGGLLLLILGILFVWDPGILAEIVS